METMYTHSLQEATAAARAEARIICGNGIIPRELLEDEEVTPFAKIVYATIGLLSNWVRRGDVRQAAIAEILSSTPDVVRHAIRDLRRRGWLEVEHRAKGGNHYVLKTAREDVVTEASREEYRRVALEFSEACRQPAAAAAERPNGPTEEELLLARNRDLATMTRLVGKVRVLSTTSTEQPARVASEGRA